MNANLEIEVFRAGDYGPKGAYTSEDLRQIASDYAPACHEAPVTLDHRQDGPAFGWVAGLRCVGDVLVARLKDLHAALCDWIRQGAYKKRSIELYRSFAQTGRPYLRAVSFLGACPPEVKGLADPIFREDDGERVVVEFDDRPQPATPGPAGWSDKSDQSDLSDSSDWSDPSDSPQTAIASLREEAAHLTAELGQERADRRRADVERFCEEARRQGRILPAWEHSGLVQFMLALDDREPQIEIAAAQRVTVFAWFRDFLAALPPPIQLGELTPAQSPNELARPAIPRPSDRAAIRPQSLVLHEKAVAFCRQHAGVTYIEALQAVARM
jgi:hypothetical protein